MGKRAKGIRIEIEPEWTIKDLAYAVASHTGVRRSLAHKLEMRMEWRGTPKRYLALVDPELLLTPSDIGDVLRVVNWQRFASKKDFKMIRAVEKLSSPEREALSETLIAKSPSSPSHMNRARQYGGLPSPEARMIDIPFMQDTDMEGMFMFESEPLNTGETPIVFHSTPSPKVSRVLSLLGGDGMGECGGDGQCEARVALIRSYLGIPVPESEMHPDVEEIDITLDSTTTESFQVHESKENDQAPSVGSIGSLTRRRKKERKQRRRQRRAASPVVWENFETLVREQTNPDGLGEAIFSLPVQLVEESHVSKLEPCAICLLDYDVGDSLTRLPCFHTFHSVCIGTWLRNSCKCPSDMLPIELNAISE